jgi:hypothetical protein
VQQWLWALRQDGQWVELKLLPALVDSELRSMVDVSSAMASINPAHGVVCLQLLVSIQSFYAMGLLQIWVASGDLGAPTRWPVVESSDAVGVHGGQGPCCYFYFL